MTKYFNDQILREIISKIDIVEIIGETVQLNRKGNRYWGICPFHSEKTSSFSVTPDKDMFYCFGCNTGGDVFSFIMKRDGVSFIEAVETLAEKARVELKPLTKENTENNLVLQVNKIAAEYYNQILFNETSRIGIEYLNKRGVSEKTIVDYQLGYSTDDWNNLENYLIKLGISKKIIQLSGLVAITKDKTRFYDLFRNRIIFPIQNFSGDIVGFGGRVLDNSLPKYLNTPETNIYSKRKNLYGLFQAKESIRQQNEAILVEGYMDSIKLNQADIKNSVASLGTAFTDEQADLLKRYCEKVLIIFDGDEAGQRETLRAISALVKADLRVDVVALPSGKDPDGYIMENGKEEFLRYIQNNRYNYIEFKINRYLNSTNELNLENKSRIIKAVKDDINHLNSEIEKDYFLRLLAKKLMLEENIVYKEMISSKKSSKLTENTNKIQISRDNKRYGNYSIQEKILAKMIRDADFFSYVSERISIDFFKNPEHKEIINLYRDYNTSDKEEVDISTMMTEKGFSSTWARLQFVLDEELNIVELTDYIKKILILKEKAKWDKLFNEINVLSEQGNFNKVLEFILKIDNFMNNTQKGGTK